jgi:hypothetical protein
MPGVGRLEFGLILFVLGLAIGLSCLVWSLIRRGRASPTPPGTPVSQRPIWLVVVLTVLTLGMYLHVWFGRSWSELARVAGPLDLSTGSHQWAMAMGFDFFSRVRAHFHAINEQLAWRGLPLGAAPGTAIAMIASFVLIPVLVANGQRSLNQIWKHDFGPASKVHVATGEWVAILALGLMFAAVAVLVIPIP